MFSPIFTSGKLKTMTKFITETSRRLVSSLDEDFEACQEVNLRTKFHKFSMDTITSCTYSIDAESFKNEDSKFLLYAREIFKKDMIDFAKFIGPLFPGIGHVMEFLGITVCKAESTKFFYNVVKKTVEHRIQTKERQNDLIDLMIDAMKDPEDITADKMENVSQFDRDAQLIGHKVKKKEFDLPSLAATAFVMLVGGYETTGSMLCNLGWALATNPDIQHRLQKEVDEAMEANGGELPDYKATLELEYLDMVIHETLRRFPPLPLLHRVCNDDWNLPGHPGLKVT